MSLHIWHENVGWLSKISAVDRNDQEELTSVYEVQLYAILCQKLVQWQERQHSILLCFQTFFNYVGDIRHLVYYRRLFLKPNWCISNRCFSSIMGLRCLSVSFSNSFNMIGSNETGRCDSTSYWAFHLWWDQIQCFFRLRLVLISSATSLGVMNGILFR
jgi:hypothetical protein